MANIGKRIMIVGSGGSGKSTLSRRLGELLSLPVIHLDAEFWNEGWVKTPKKEWQQKLNGLVLGDEWIIDGNFDSSLDVRLKRADTMIFLDINRFVCLKSVIKRRIKYRNRTRPDMHQGCTEKIDFEFLRWIWGYPKKCKPVILQKVSEYKNVNLIVLTNRKKINRFIAEFQQAANLRHSQTLAIDEVSD